MLSPKVKLGDLGLAQCSVDRERDLVAWQTNSCFLFKGRNNGENIMQYVWKAMEHTSRKINMEPQNGGLEYHFPFQMSDFQLLCEFSGEYKQGGMGKGRGGCFLGQFLVGTSWDMGCIMFGLFVAPQSIYSYLYLLILRKRIIHFG